MLPRVLLVTDPARIPDPVTVADRLPPGTGVVYRAFGRPDALETGLALAAVCRRRRLILLVGADERLAARLGAAGLHLPERMLPRVKAIRARHPNWLITGAAHSARALRQAAGLDAILLSPVFKSRSPSAKSSLGTIRLAALIRATATPVYALGGMTPKRIRRLRGTGAAGIAAVEALA